MRITLDLPDDLMRAMKLRALHEGRKLKDVLADLLRKDLGAGADSAPPTRRPKIFTDKKTGLPSIKGKPGAPIAKMCAEEIYALIHKTQEEEDLERFGVSLRR
jgi:hypothetical protein